MTDPTPPIPASAPSRLRRWLLDAPPLVLLGVAAAAFVAGFGTRRAIGSAVITRQAAEARLDSARRDAAAAGDSLAAVQAVTAGPAGDTAFIVVSIAENRLWYKRRDSVLFTTRVATGTGGELKKTAGSKATWKFDTPRGRLKVERKDEAPMWVPPDWHFVELAKKKKLSLVFLKGAMTVPVGDGSVIALNGQDVVRRMPDGREIPYDAREGREIIVGRRLIVPPLGTHQRRFAGVLGAFRLYLGDGYGIHGTDVPSSIGRSASHGCIRVRNEDIEVLYQLVSVGTPVLVY